MSQVDLFALSDLRTPWCVHVAATLRIAHHIAAGKHGIEELAAAAECDSTVLHAVLSLLTKRGVFEEPEPGRFLLNDAARGLLDPMVGIGLDLNGIGGRMAHSWSTLLAFTRTGKPAYSEVFGLPFWEDLQAHPEIAASFDAIMGPAGHGLPDPLFELAQGWDLIRTVVDVGGGTGSMLDQLLIARPQLKGTLVDQPGTVERAVSDRFAIVGQSFFDPLPAGADLYLLRGVINDWADAEAAAILRRCAEAARPNGRVVILKSVFADGAPRELGIEMVVAGGKQRTLTVFTELAHQSGLDVVAWSRQNSGHSVVECRVV